MAVICIFFVPQLKKNMMQTSEGGNSFLLNNQVVLDLSEKIFDEHHSLIDN